MSTSAMRPFLIDRRDLVRVTYKESESGEAKTLTAIACRFAVANGGIATEIIYDPENQEVEDTYMFDPQDARRILLNPNWLLRVSPLPLPVATD